ncbi:hypothetical protein HQ533_06530 [Candidatus Woesearchaeota archaeon]|nr:hypothetical protein [Candidatus Woesearchaeota archaeon]
MTEVIQNTFEWTCTGNSGRSEPSRIASLNDFKAKGLQNLFFAISSGTKVNQIMSGFAPSMDYMKETIDQALKRDDLHIYTPLQKEDLAAAIVSNNSGQVAAFYSLAVKAFVNEEHALRDEMLVRFGIGTHEDLKGVQEQTIVRPEVIAIVGMAQENLDVIEKIYDGAETKPKVMTTFNIENTFGKGRQAYENCIAQLVEKIPKFQDTVIEQYGLQ